MYTLGQYKHWHCLKEHFNIINTESRRDILRLFVNHYIIIVHRGEMYWKYFLAHEYNYEAIQYNSGVQNVHDNYERLITH